MALHGYPAVTSPWDSMGRLRVCFFFEMERLKTTLLKKQRPI